MATKELAVQGKIIEVSLREGITHNEAMHVVDSICNSLSRAETTVEQTYLALGKVMNDIEARNLFLPEYRIFSDFVAAVAKKHRMSESNTWKIYRNYKVLPSLTIKEVETIPRTSLGILVQAVAANPDLTPARVNRLKAKAQTEPFTKFRDHLRDENLIGRAGRPTLEATSKKATLKIAEVSRTVINKFDILCGSGSPAAIFTEMVNERYQRQSKAA